MKAYLKYGMDTLDMIKINPYILCDDSVELDFKRADTIAYDLSIEKNSDKRIIAGIKYILKANTACGHSCLPLDFLSSKAVSVLNISESDFYDSYDIAIEENEIFEYIKNDREYVYLPEYYHAEKFIADRINVLKDFTPPENYDCESLIDAEEKSQGIKYENLQREAISSAVSKGLMILTGGPGTGKTTTLEYTERNARRLLNSVSHFLNYVGGNIENVK